MSNEGSTIEIGNQKYTLCKDYGDMSLISSLDAKKYFLWFRCLELMLPCTGKSFSRYAKLEKGELIFNGVHFPVKKYDVPSCNVKRCESNLHGRKITFSILLTTKELMLVN